MALKGIENAHLRDKCDNCLIANICFCTVVTSLSLRTAQKDLNFGPIDQSAA